MSDKDAFLSNCIVLDTETTSLDYKIAQVIELGYTLYSQNEWVVINELYKADVPIPYEVSAITNISNKMVQDCDEFVDHADAFNTLLEEFQGVAVAHNAFYDMRVLDRYNIKSPTWLCTLRLAKKMYAEDDTVTAFNLGYLRYRFGILEPADNENPSAHRAGDDAHVTALLLEHLIGELESRNFFEPGIPYIMQLTEWLDQPIIHTIMPFGKHKGTKLTDVPMSYWNWALSNMDALDENADNYDKDLAASVALALEDRV